MAFVVYTIAKEHLVFELIQTYRMYALAKAITATSRKTAFSTQLAYAFFDTAYTIMSMHPIMFMPRYSTDWLLTRPRLFRPKAETEKQALAQPTASPMNLRNVTIVSDIKY